MLVPTTGSDPAPIKCMAIYRPVPIYAYTSLDPAPIKLMGNIPVGTNTCLDCLDFCMAIDRPVQLNAWTALARKMIWLICKHKGKASTLWNHINIFRDQIYLYQMYLHFYLDIYTLGLWTAISSKGAFFREYTLYR